MSDSFELSLRSAFAGASPGRLIAVTLPAPPGLWSEVLAFSGTSLDREPRVFWATGGEGIWVGRGAVTTLRAQGQERFSKLQSLVEKLFLSIDNKTPNSDRLRAFGGAAFLPHESESGAARAFGNASFVLPRLTYVDADQGSSLTIVSDGDDLDAIVRFVELLPLRRMDDSPAQDRAGPSVVSIPSKLDPSDADSFQDLVRSIQRGISAKQFDKVVLARRVRALLGREPELGEVMARLMASGPDSVRFAYAVNGSTFLGATPERLVRVRGRELEADALAGTIPRAADDAKERLLGSAKDRREHEFVVRAIETALAPLVDELVIGSEPEVTELPQLFHLRTPIRARLRSPHHAFDLVARLHPTPAVGGFPREPALLFIEENEPDSRGWYAGPFGWVDPQGDGEFVVALRSAFIEGRTADLFAGAGIVVGSDPEAEFEETELKLGRMLGALGISREGRSRDPERRLAPLESDVRAHSRQP